jgi:hypothetical protein
MNVNCVIDISNISPERIPTSKTLRMRCWCKKKGTCKPAYLNLPAQASSVREIKELLVKTHRIMFNNISVGKKVAIVCYYGVNVSVAVAIYYIMQVEKLPLQVILDDLQSRAGVDLAPVTLKALRDFEK